MLSFFLDVPGFSGKEDTRLLEWVEGQVLRDEGVYSFFSSSCLGVLSSSSWRLRPSMVNHRLRLAASSVVVIPAPKPCSIPTSCALRPSMPPSMLPTHFVPSMSKTSPSIRAPSSNSFLRPSWTAGSWYPGFARRVGAGKRPGCGERMLRAALRCCGLTVGKVSAASGPVRRGVSGCWFMCCLARL